MRLSVLSTDPGYAPDARRYRVKLGGVERWNVITADEERREADLYVLDDRGAITFDEETCLPKQERFYGDVVIIAPEGTAVQDKLWSDAG